MKKFLFTLATVFAAALAVNAAQAPVLAFSENEITMAPGETYNIDVVFVEDAGVVMQGMQAQWYMYDESHQPISAGVTIPQVNLGTPRQPNWQYFTPGVVMNDMGAPVSSSCPEGYNYRIMVVNTSTNTILMGDEVAYYTGEGITPVFFTLTVEMAADFEGKYATLELFDTDDFNYTWTDANQQPYYPYQDSGAEMVLKINNANAPAELADFTGEIVFGELNEETGQIPVSYNGPEEVNLVVTVNGEEVEIVDGMITLPTYGEYEVVATITAEGYNPDSRMKIFTWEEPVVPQDLAGEIVIGEPNEDGVVVITYTGEEEVTITVTVNGEEVELGEGNTITVGEGESEIVVTVTAEGYNELTKTETVTYDPVVVPEVTATPVINYDAETFTVTVEGDGEIHCYVNDEEVTLPYTFEQGDEDVTYVITATAQEDGKEISETATLEVVVPAKVIETEVTPAPEIVITETEDAIIIDAIGEGEIHVYVNGEEVEIPCTIAKGEEEVTIVVTATAQGEDMEISETVEKTVVVPALSGETPEDPHMTGAWIVLINENDEEVWYAMTYDEEDGDWYFMKTLHHQPWPEDVPFYFMVDGVRYGAEVDMTLPEMGDYEHTILNPVFETENYFYVPAAFTYTWGLQFVDGEIYLLVAQGKMTGVDELNADKAVASVRYFNMTGQEMKEVNGATIVVTTYTDGTTNAVKVIK